MAFDGALKVEVPTIEGTSGERTTAELMPLGLSFLQPVMRVTFVSRTENIGQ